MIRGPECPTWWYYKNASQGCFVPCSRIFCTIHILPNSLAKRPTHTTTMKVDWNILDVQKRQPKNVNPQSGQKKVVFWDTFSGFCTLAAPPETSPKMAARRPGGREELGAERGRGFSGLNPLNASSMPSWPSSGGLGLLERVRVGKGLELSPQCVYPWSERGELIWSNCC